MNEWEFQLLEDRNPVPSLIIGGVELKSGDRIRLRPRPGGDIFDLALTGQIAIVESIEQDYEGKSHIAVVLESDPGRDLGLLRQPGHRFFFSPEEVEPLGKATKILVAGIGNIFLGDDAFGVEVVRRLSNLPEDVTAKDFGIRSYDLAYALLDDYDAAILIDAAPRDGAPGTLYVLEPEIEDQETQPILDAHAMNPVSVLRMARNLGPVKCRILLVGCEPASLGGEEGEIGLSEAVSSAIDEAVRLVEKLVAELLEAQCESRTPRVTGG